MATVNSSNTTTLYSTTQTTPVQTGADIPQGQVNDTNFTTLYANNQGNATGGGVSGNLLVRGNLRVLGTSDLEGAVTISNSYIMPTTDGTNLQVLSTDGNGNATWQNISAVAGYAIQADTATGGADLTLTQVGTPVDAVKFAGGTNITVSRTNANTITISTVADNIPDGTAQGQVLYWNGSAWVASNNVTSSASANRFSLQYNNSTAGPNAILFMTKNYGATPYTTNDGSGLAFLLDSDSQTANQLATINAIWKGSPSATEITLNTNTLDNTVGPFTPTATFSVAQATLPGDLAVNGGDITTTSVTGNLFNANAVVVNIGDGATTEVNLGSAASGRVQIKPNTIVGANTTQNVFNTVATTANAFGAATTVNMGANSGTMTIGNPTVVGTQATQALYNTVATTVNAFGAANALNMASASSLTTLGNNLSINGTELKINADGAGSPADGFIYFNGTNESLKWNQTDTRFELSDQLYITQTEVPAVFERRVTTAEVNPSEAKGAIRLLQRVTDAASNATDDSGPAVVFGRTSGATTATEQLFAGMGSVWYGTTNKAALQFNWSPDNYPEPTPGVFPTTYTLLRLNSDYAEFFNNSVYVNYANVASTKTATSITGGNTLVFGTAHGYTAGTRILYQTASTNGLLQSVYYYVLATGLTSTQCQVSTISGGTAVALTNGTGLTLTFAEVNNRVGVNTDTPAYTLDVDGDLRVTGDIISAGITAGNITVGVVNDNTISTTTGSLDITAATSQEVTISTTTSTDPVTIVRNSATNNNSIRTLTLRANTTNASAPVIDFGNFLEFETETTPGTFARSGGIDNRSTGDNGAGVLDEFEMAFSVMSAGTNTERMVLDNLGNLQIDGDLAVNGGDITTTQTTASVFNTTATTVEAFGAATNVTIGIDGAVPLAGGTTTIRSAITVVKGDLQVNGDNTGSVANISTTKTSAAVFDTNATTIDAFGAATTLGIGANTGTLTIGNPTIVGTQTTQNLYNTTATTVNAFGAATTINIGAATGTTTINNDLDVNGVATVESLNIDGRAVIDTGTVTRTSTVQFTLDTTTRNAIKCMVYMERGTDSHAVEILIMRTSTDAMITTYGEMYTTSPLAQFTADQDAGSIRILATPTSATSTTFSVVRCALT